MSHHCGYVGPENAPYNGMKWREALVRVLLESLLKMVPPHTMRRSCTMKGKICSRTAALDINHCIIYWEGSGRFYVSCLKGSGEWLSWVARRPQSVLTEVWLCGCNILVKGCIYKSWRWSGIQLDALHHHRASQRVINLVQIQVIFRRMNTRTHTHTEDSPGGLNRARNNFTLFYKELLSRWSETFSCSMDVCASLVLPCFSRLWSISLNGGGQFISFCWRNVTGMRAGERTSADWRGVKGQRERHRGVMNGDWHL